MINPKPVQNMTPQDALLMYPSMDLDRWLFLRVLDGPEDFPGSMPRLSQNFGECQPLMLQTVMTTGAVTIDISPEYFEEGIAARQLHRKTPGPLWKMTSGEYVGYGRNFAEAIAKLSICRVFDLKDPRRSFLSPPDPGTPSA